MKTEDRLPKSGSQNLVQKKFPKFGYVYLTLLVVIQFVWGGLRASKILLLVEELGFSENESVIIMHLQSSLMDIVACIGNIIANMHCGPYITVLFQDLSKVLFTCPLCTIATTGLLSLDWRRILYLIGQVSGVFTAFANSCLASFLGDQFNVENYLIFNRAQVIIIMSSSALGIFTIPHIIQYYHCFWTNTCYSLIWLCEWAVCFICLFMLVVFWKGIEKNKPKASSTYMMMLLIRNAMKNKRAAKKLGLNTNRPLLDYSTLYTPQFRKDAKKVWSLWTFYFPLAGYWALHSQQSTTWILQAKRLNGDLLGWSTVLPNELWGIIPLTGVAIRSMLVPLMDDTAYPLRITVVSHLVMSLAFMSAAILERYINVYGDQNVHMAWALPQLLCVSFSDISLIMAYRKFVLREVPPAFRGVTQNLFILSRSFGNLIVVLFNFLELMTGFPGRLAQFIIYASGINLFLIVFTVLNSKFERLLQTAEPKSRTTLED